MEINGEAIMILGKLNNKSWLGKIAGAQLGILRGRGPNQKKGILS